MIIIRYKEIFMFENSMRRVQMLNALMDLKKELEQLGPVPTGRAIYDYVPKYYLKTSTFIKKYGFAQTIDKIDFKKNNESFEELKNIFKEADDVAPVIVIGSPNLTLINIKGVYFDRKKWADTFDLQELMEIKDPEVQKQIQNNLTQKIKENKNQIFKHIDLILNNNKKPDGLLFRTFGKAKVAGR